MLPVWLTDSVTSDLDRALHYTLLWGLEGIVLRTMGGASDVVPHVDEVKLKQRLAKHGLPLAAVVPNMFRGEVANRPFWLNELVQFKETLGFCRRVGCTRVIVSAFAASDESARGTAAVALRRAGEAAASSSVTLAVLNEARALHPDGRSLAALLEAVDHPSVCAAWSPAAAVQVGEHPQAGLEALAGRVELVCCSDGLLLGGTWREKPIGEGEVGWLGQLRLLHEQGFDGPVSLEINVEPRPKYGLRAATRLIQMLREVATV